MKKFVLLLCSASSILALGIGLSSCKDDEPFVKPNLSVGSETVSFAEGAGTIEVEVVLDRGAPADITIEYDLGGTALSPADYTIVGREGEVEIAKGATSGIISIQIVSDATYEGNETIEISLEDVDSDDVVITNDDETVVTITDDDTQIIASFAVTTLSVNEEDGLDGLLEIEVKLDKQATSDVTVQYEIDGSALDSLYAFNQDPKIPSEYYDYYIHGVSGKVVIETGETSGKIEVQLYTDFLYEPTDENIIFTLKEANGGVQIGDADEITISLKQQSGKVIALLWDPRYRDVDMDMFLWVGENVTSLDGVLTIAALPDTTQKQEIIFLPSSVFPNAAYGLSYIYYSGTSNPMNFEVQFADFINGALEPIADRDIFTASYTLANINPWDQASGTDPVIAQTFKKTNGVVMDISGPIVPPASGSRMKTYSIPKGLKRIKSHPVIKAQNFF